GEPGVLQIPAGSIMNRYFTHRLGLGPFVGDTSQPALSYALWMLKMYGFWRYFTLMGWYFSFVWRVVRWAGRSGPATAAADLAHAARRAELERAQGMPAGAMAAIEGVAPP